MHLVYGKEKILFAIAATISIILWAAIIGGTMGVALIYILVFFVFYIFMQSAFISYLKGTGVQITAEQFPDLHQSIVDSAKKLDIKKVPDAYLIHADGAFNALATRFLGRHFIVLYSDVVDALEDNADAVRFYIGHELGHIKRKHLVWGPILAPAMLLPLLGAGYSRAREYTCDRHGLAACNDPQSAEKGLAALAAGSKRWKQLNNDNYASQSRQTSGFWMSLHELAGDYPWLTKRMATLQALSRKQEPKHPRRNLFAWIIALFIPRLGYVGGASSILVVFVIIGVLAAVAIPAYQDYTNKMAIASAYKFSEPYRQGVLEYVSKNRRWPESNADIGMDSDGALTGKWTSSIRVGEGGAISVELSGRKLSGKTLIIQPDIRHGHLSWKCRSHSLPMKYIPNECR